MPSACCVAGGWQPQLGLHHVPAAHCRCDPRLGVHPAQPGHALQASAVPHSACITHACTGSLHDSLSSHAMSSMPACLLPQLQCVRGRGQAVTGPPCPMQARPRAQCRQRLRRLPLQPLHGGAPRRAAGAGAVHELRQVAPAGRLPGSPGPREALRREGRAGALRARRGALRHTAQTDCIQQLPYIQLYVLCMPGQRCSATCVDGPCTGCILSDKERVLQTC